MASLDSFNDTSGASLDSFQIDGSLQPVGNPASNKNLAAYTAALSEDPESIEATYLQTSDDMDQQGASPLTIQISKKAQEYSYAKEQRALISILGDTSISDEEKERAADNFLDRTNEAFNVRNHVSREAIIADSGDNETVEAENARISLSGAIEEVNRSKRRTQARLNAELSKTDPSLMQTAFEIADMMTPFAEGESVGAVMQKTGGSKADHAKAMALLGSSKEELSKKLYKLPPSKRGPLTEKLIDAINSSPGVVLADDNDYQRKELLKTALEEGHYSDVDKWVDNVVSMLDMTIIGGVVGRGVKASRAFLKGRRLAEEAKVAEDAAREAELAAQLPDDELRAAEDASEARLADRNLRGAEDSSEKRIAARRRALEEDAVRKAEDAAAARQRAKKAVYTDDDSLIKLEDEYEQEIGRKNYVRSEVQPTSLSQNYKETNPAKARNANKVAGDAPDDRVADALYGSSKTEAVAHDELGEIARSDGSVKNKVSMPDRAPKTTPPPRPRIMDKADLNGAIYLDDADKAATATRVVHDFNNATGLTTRKEMIVPEVDEVGGGFKIGVTYGPKDMGWADGREAMDLVKFSLRHYGLKDKDLTLMERLGDDYVPVSPKDATPHGDYLVKVDYPYKMTAEDVDPEDWTDQTVLYNFWDRKPHTNTSFGSFTRHLLDAASLLSPRISLGANVAVDKSSALEKAILKEVELFSKPFSKLKKDRQQILENIIKEANYNGRFPTRTELKTGGISDHEVNLLKKWRDAWDSLYWLENSDQIKTLKNKGYGVLEDESTNSKLFVKEVARNQAGKFKRVYDLQEGRIRNLDKSELKELYDSGGSVARLRSPMKDGEDVVDAVIATNKPGSSYVRGLREDDTVLNYREGYYTVYYDAPHFIEEIVKDSSGIESYRRAVSTAGTRKDANLVAERLRKTTGGEYNVREDVKNVDFDGDTNWDLNLAQGRTSQRIRGERLEDSTSPITSPDHNYMLGPVDSLIASVRSVSNRVPMRDYLETVKARAMHQYAEVFPKDKYGNVQFPSHSSKVEARGQQHSKLAADARTTVEYVTYLENGYANAVDDFIKATFRGLADALGNRGFETGEKLARKASEMKGPTSVGKGQAFTLYLATHPSRQFIVQGHQAIQLIALSPKYASTRLAGDVSALLQQKFTGGVNKMALKGTGKTEEEWKRMLEMYEDSGLSAGIDKQNLIRGSLTDLAQKDRMGGSNHFLAKGIAGLRKIGFDAGEEFNMMTAWLTHYDMAKQAKKGKALTQSDLEMVAAKARDFTYNMNRAGDMPYNENVLGIMFQFMQVPHKSLLQMTTNRNLSKAQKAKIAGFNALMYGAPPGSLMYAFLKDFLPEDGEGREAILQGAESYAINKFLTMTYGDSVGIDFSSLSATDGKGLWEFATSLMTTDVGEIVASSPAGSLYFGNNPRITNFARTAASFFHFTEPADGSPTTLSETFAALGDLSSGTSSLFKAKAALEYAKRYNSYGGVVDSNVNTPEAVARIFGFGSLDEARKYAVSGEIYEQRKAFDDDVKEMYKQAKKAIARKGITADEQQYQISVLNWANKVFEDSPRAKEIIKEQLKYDVQNQDMAMYKAVSRASGFLTPSEHRDLIKNSPMSDDMKKTALERLDMIESYNNEE